MRQKEEMMTKMYIYDEATMQCLQVVTGEPAAVTDYTTAQFEQHGYPACYSPDGLSGVAEADTLAA